MKKLVALLLTLCMVLSVMVFASAETLTGSAQGFGSEVKVELTVEDGKIVDLKVKDSGESYPVPGKTVLEKSLLPSSRQTALRVWTSIPAPPLPVQRLWRL